MAAIRSPRTRASRGHAQRRAIRPRPVAADRERARASYLGRLQRFELVAVGGRVPLPRLEIVAEDPLDFAERGDGVQSLAQLGGPGKALHVPAEVLSELDRRAFLVGLV